MNIEILFHLFQQIFINMKLYKFCSYPVPFGQTKHSFWYLKPGDLVVHGNICYVYCEFQEHSKHYIFLSGKDSKIVPLCTQELTEYHN